MWLNFKVIIGVPSLVWKKIPSMVAKMWFYFITSIVHMLENNHKPVFMYKKYLIKPYTM